MDTWLASSQHTVGCTSLWKGDPLPKADTVDGLIVMGGPMGVYDDALYPWLKTEKTLIREVIDQDKPVLGICLGAQLIAEVLGARVWKNKHKEIGFFPLRGDGDVLPAEFTAFHWHGDTFDLPEGARPLASSAATKNQAFLYRERVLALQFHFETTEVSLMTMYQHGSDEIVPGPFIQTVDETRPFFEHMGAAHQQMFGLLNQLFS